MKTILFVDDEIDLVKIVSMRLEERGYNILTAHNGVEALEQIKSVFPDLIILDVNMPKMGGIEFYKNILDEEGVPKCPVLIMTARGELKEMFTKDMETAGFIEKPFKLDELITKIQEILKKSDLIG